MESHFLRILSGLGILESLVRLDDGVDLPEAVSSSDAGLSRCEPEPAGGVWLWPRPTRDALAKGLPLPPAGVLYIGEF